MPAQSKNDPHYAFRQEMRGHGRFMRFSGIIGTVTSLYGLFDSIPAEKMEIVARASVLCASLYVGIKLGNDFDRAAKNANPSYSVVQSDIKRVRPSSLIIPFAISAYMASQALQISNEMAGYRDEYRRYHEETMKVLAIAERDPSNAMKVHMKACPLETQTMVLDRKTNQILVTPCMPAFMAN